MDSLIKLNCIFEKIDILNRKYPIYEDILCQVNFHIIYPVQKFHL